MPSSYLSRLGNAVHHEIQRSGIGQGGGLQESIEFILGQGKLLCEKSRFFHSKPFSSLSDLHELLCPGTFLVARSYPHLADQKRTLSVVGTLSRTFSIPSVSGPSLQACAYHVDSGLSKPDVFSHVSQKTSMAARGVLGDCHLYNLISRHAHLSAYAKHGSNLHDNTSFNRCRKASMSLKSQEQHNNGLLHGYFMYSASKRKSNAYPNNLSGLRHFHGSLAAHNAAGAATDVSFHSSQFDEQLANSPVSSEQYVIMQPFSYYLVLGTNWIQHMFHLFIHSKFSTLDFVI